MPEMLPVNIDNVLSKLSPSEREKLILIRTAGDKYGKAAYPVVDRLLKETPIDSPNFSEQAFWGQVEEALKG